MSGLPARAKLYWIAIVSSGFAVVAIACAALALSTRTMRLSTGLSFLVLAGVAIVAERMEVPLTTFDDESAKHSIGSVTYVAAIVVLPWYAAVLTAMLALTVACLKDKSVKFLFNCSNAALSVAAAAGVFALLGADRALVGNSSSNVIHAFATMLLVAATYYIIMSAITLNMVALASGQRPIQVYRTVILKTTLQEVTTIGLGFMLGGFWLFNPAFVPLVALPVVMAYFSIETFVRIQQETRQAVLEMAKSIDLRDPATRLHSQRVAKLSVALAQQLDLSHEQVANIELSALVHDIGKIGIPNEILNKPGKLTDDERGQMEAHPVIGYEMLRHYKQFRNGLDIVRSHHERWDGNGYPDRIPASQLSLEARIVCIADAYEAMTADRPYRKAMSSFIAYGRLQEAAGTQFDPHLVPLFQAALLACGEMDAAQVREAAQEPVVSRQNASLAIAAATTQAHSIKPLYRPRRRTLHRLPAANGRCRPPLVVGHSERGA